MRDLKLAFRTLFKTPFVTVVAILSLGLGIGANAAIFSMFNQMLLQPLPVSDPSRLVNFADPGVKSGSSSCNDAGSCNEVFSYPMYRDLEKANTAFSGLAAHRMFGVNLAMAGQTPINGEGMYVSGSYFPVLGLRPALGRLLTSEDDRTIGGHYVAVLSYSYWEQQLGSNPNVVGQQITVNGEKLTVQGVAPRGFNGTTLGGHPALFVPITMRGVLTHGFRNFENRRAYWVYLFGRLKPGATLEQATASINAVYAPIIKDVDAPLQTGASEKYMTQFRAKKVVLSEGYRGQSSIHTDAKVPLIMLFSITVIVLLIACANIANLLLARAANRQMEMAVRLSLGATRRQLVRQLLTESVLLALLGGAVSIYIARLTLDGIVALMKPEAVQALDFSLSIPAMLFAGGLSLVTGLVFGLVPALQSTRPDLVTELRNNSGKISGSRGAARFRTSLVTAQVALSMALLVSAGLFIKSLHNVSRADIGLEIDNLAMFAISPDLSGYDSTRGKQLFARTEEALRAIPGVTGVTTAMIPILGNSTSGQSVTVEGFRKVPDGDNDANWNAVGPDHFRVLGVPILAGRDFTVGDNGSAPRVAIVNETFAKKFNLGRNAVGKHMSMGNDSLNIEIVGLVKDSKYSEVKSVVPPVFVIPYRQVSGAGTTTFYVRSALPLEQIFPAIRQTMRQLDPALPIESLKSMPQQVKDNVFVDRMISTMSAAFACLATLLAAIGLYGVLAYSVAQRTREIGVRMALGADGGRVRGMVLRQVGMMTLVGGVIGMGGAYALGRGAKSLLYQLEGHDPMVFASAAALLTLIAMAAGFLPALRASRIDPMNALRQE